MGISREPGAANRRIRMDLGQASPEQLLDLISQLMDVAGLDREERIELLGKALVTEIVEPFWDGTRTPDEAHAALRETDPSLAGTVEAIAPVLYGRAAVSAVEDLLGLR